MKKTVGGIMAGIGLILTVFQGSMLAILFNDEAPKNFVQMMGLSFIPMSYTGVGASTTVGIILLIVGLVFANTKPGETHSCPGCMKEIPIEKEFCSSCNKVYEQESPIIMEGFTRNQENFHSSMLPGFFTGVAKKKKMGSMA